MKKVNCVIDTSAAISLGLTGRFELAARIFSFTGTSRVKEELVEITGSPDEIGRVADEILKSGLISFITLEIGIQSDKGEIEVVNLSKNRNADLVLMDDAQARKKLQKDCKAPIRFSPFAIFMLCKNKLLTRKEALSAIEDMQTKRQWKENLIIEYAKFLFEKEEK